MHSANILTSCSIMQHVIYDTDEIFDYLYDLKHEPTITKKCRNKKTNGEKKSNHIYLTDKCLEAALLPQSKIITILINATISFCMKIQPLYLNSSIGKDPEIAESNVFQMPSQIFSWYRRYNFTHFLRYVVSQIIRKCTRTANLPK